MLDPYKMYRISEMRKLRPQFFSNAPSAERYHVRKNHLIVKRVSDGQISVWQFHWVDDDHKFSPVWFPSHKSRGDDSDMTLEEVLITVETLLETGTLPLHPYNGFNQEARFIGEEE